MRHTLYRIALVTAVLGTSVITCAGVAGAGVFPPCERGEFCLWEGESYTGTGQRISLDNTNPGECVPLPAGFDARSFANRSSRPVTVYQHRECATEGEFDTYPGGGTFVPEAPYVVRAVQLWSH